MTETDPKRPTAGPWLRAAYRRLLAAYGPQHWWPAQGPLEIIVGAVLTQNTSWRGVERAIANLRSARLLSLSALLRLGQEEMARHIRPAGCPNVKTRRLANLLALVRSRGGIAGLRRLPTPRLRAELLAVSGVGPETADSVLLYALGRPVFVIDAYTRRVLSRHRVIVGRESYADLQALCHSALPRRTRLYREYHALLVRVGKEHCRARPACQDPHCPLLET